MPAPYFLASHYKVLTTLAKWYILLVEEVSTMATTNINVRVDTELRQEAEALFEDLGQRITSNEQTRAALAEYDEMKDKTGKYKRYNSFDELLNEE